VRLWLASLLRRLADRIDPCGALPPLDIYIISDAFADLTPVDRTAAIANRINEVN
jgi:hypothetical protein